MKKADLNLFRCGVLIVLLTMVLPLTAVATDVIVADANGNELTYSYDAEDGPATFKGIKTYSADQEKAGHIVIADNVTDANGVSHEVKYISGSVGNRSGIVNIVFGQNIVATGGPEGSENDAFYNCDKLVSVTLNAKLEILGRFTFQSCDMLGEINLSDCSKLTTIMYRAFQNADHVRQLTIPSSVTTIEAEAFTNIDSLRTVTFADESQLATLGDAVFCDNVRLESINIESCSLLTAIPYNTFAGCQSLKSLKLSDAVQTVGQGAFYNTKSMTEITFGTGLTELNDDWGLFYNAPLQKMVLPGVNYPFPRDYNLPRDIILYVHPDLEEEYRSNNCTKDYHISPIGVTTEYDVTTTEGGELQSKIAEDLALYTQSLTVSGPINGTDINFLHSSFPNLQVLNLTNARIVAGGDKYNQWEVEQNGNATVHPWERTWETEDDVVGNKMFFNMPSLISLSLPSATKKIGNYALAQNVHRNLRLAHIDIPAGVTEIGDHAFYYTGIEEVTVPEGVTRLEEYTFHYCKKLKKAVLPDGITFIGNSCFSEDDLLEDVNIPAKTDTIDQYAFFNNQKRNTPIVFPAGLKIIGNCAFQHNYLLPSVTFNDGLEKIGEYAFYDCHLIEEAVLPESVTSLGNDVFYRCDSLRQFKFPSAIKEVPNSFLGSCGSLERVTLAPGTTKIGWAAFDHCNKLSEINLNEQDKLTMIDSYGFAYTAFTHIVLPNSISKMGYSVFRECPELESINVPTGIDYVPDDFVCYCPKVTSVQMHDGIRRVGHNAFLGCTSLPSIDLNDKITGIEYNAFNNCMALQLTKLPDSLTHIGYYAFSGTKAITGVLTIPTGVKTIEYNAFYKSGITGIVLPEGITSWGTGLFASCDSLKIAVLPEDITRIQNYMFQYCKSLEQIELPDSVKEIGYCAFDQSALTSIELPENIKKIEDNAFSSTQLRTFRVPDGFTDGLGAHALDNCKRLKTAYMGRNEDYTTYSSFTIFNNCDSLELLRVYAGTPPSSDIWNKDFRKNCVLEVPEGTVDLYKAAMMWQDFKEIREFFSGDEMREQDFAVMKIIYENLNGASWTKTWDLENSRHSANKWAGVSTMQIGTTSQYAISGLDLSSMGLTGKLPKEVFTLKDLNTLNLSRNHISGNLGELVSDTEADMLSPLKTVNLQGNEFTGDLYAFTSKLPLLQTLNVGYNQLTEVSQPINKEVLNELNLEMQFIDWHTKQVPENLSDSTFVIDMTPGIPADIELPTTLTYRHYYQDYGRNPSNLTRVYCYNTDYNYWGYTWELVKNNEGQWILDTYDTRMLHAPKNKPVAYSYDWLTVLLRFDWPDGDVNADLTVDVTDLQSVINYALNDRKEHEQMFNFTAADANNDDAINVIDVVGNVDHILSFVEVPTEASRTSEMMMTASGNNILTTERQASTASCKLLTTDEVAALQMTVSGATTRQIRLNNEISERFSVSMRNTDRGVKVVIYSPTGKTLTPGEYLLLQDMPSSAVITDVRLSDSHARYLSVTLDEVTTGIDKIANSQELKTKGMIYDLNGRQLSTDWNELSPGIYLIQVNGKQYKVKR